MVCVVLGQQTYEYYTCQVYACVQCMCKVKLGVGGSGTRYESVLWYLVSPPWYGRLVVEVLPNGKSTPGT